MSNQFQRILDLVRRTGDRMVVTDPNGQDAYVVMDLDSYEALVEFEHHYDEYDVEEMEGADELPDEFFAENAIGEFTPPSAPKAPSAPTDIWEAMQPAGEEGETWDLDRMSETDRMEMERQFAKWKEAPSETEGPAAAAQDAQNEEDEDFGEEQFYLEPVE